MTTHSASEGLTLAFMRKVQLSPVPRQRRHGGSSLPIHLIFILRHASYLWLRQCSGLTHAPSSQLVLKKVTYVLHLGILNLLDRPCCTRMHTMHYAANIRVYDLDIAGADKRGRAGPRGTEHVLAKYTGKSGYNFDPSSSEDA